MVLLLCHVLVTEELLHHISLSVAHYELASDRLSSCMAWIVFS